MRPIINRVGQVFGELEIVEELGNCEVNTRCIKCGNIAKYAKSAVVKGIAKCKKCNIKIVTNRVGQTFNNVTILQELGNNKVMGRCNDCGNEDTYNKQMLVSGKRILCKKCGVKNVKYRTIDTVGKRFGALTVLEELGQSQVRVRCDVCSSEDRVLDKWNIARGDYKSCGCLRENVSNRCIGNVYNGIKAIREVPKTEGNIKIIGLCLVCNREAEYDRYSLMSGKCQCRYEDCTNRRVKFIKDIVGKTYGNYKVLEALEGRKLLLECMLCGEKIIRSKKDVINNSDRRCTNRDCEGYKMSYSKFGAGDVIGTFKIIKDLHNKKVEAQCLKCNTVGVYNKLRITQNDVLCKNCGLKTYLPDSTRIVGNTINGLLLVKFNHKGRSGQPWYLCECIYCHKQELIKYNEIFSFKCECRGK